MQQLRRVERPRRDDDLAAGRSGQCFAARQIFDTGGAPSLEQHAGGERVRHDMQIAAPACVFQIRRRRRGTHPAPHRGLVIARAFLRGAVEIVVARIARFDRGRDKGLGERMLVAHVGHAERPAGAVEIVSAALVVLGFAEVRQHVIVAPAGIAELAPVIEVLGLTADVDQSVDRARAAERLAARRDDVAAVTLRLRLGLVAPVVTPVGEQLAVAERNVQPWMAVSGTRLQQQHAMPSGCGQPVRQDAAGAAGAHDDVIVGSGVLRHGRSHSRSDGGSPQFEPEIRSLCPACDPANKARRRVRGWPAKSTPRTAGIPSHRPRGSRRILPDPRPNGRQR